MIWIHSLPFLSAVSLYTIQLKRMLIMNCTAFFRHFWMVGSSSCMLLPEVVLKRILGYSFTKLEELLTTRLREQVSSHFYKWFLVDIPLGDHYHTPDLLHLGVVGWTHPVQIASNLWAQRRNGENWSQQHMHTPSLPPPHSFPHTFPSYLFRADKVFSCNYCVHCVTM